MQESYFYSNGKLLLSGEYLVLHGAKALAIPLKLGQDLKISIHPNPDLQIIHWKSYENDLLWFEMQVSMIDLAIQNTSNIQIANKLINVLLQAKTLNPVFLSDLKGMIVNTNLNFKKDWGLGSSSTLINNIAMWAKVNPYQLLELTFGGSGYDIACADANQAIFYTKTEGQVSIEKANFNPVFKDNLFFVYLGEKQNSADSIQHFKRISKTSSGQIDEISELGNRMAKTNSLTEFNQCVKTHEEIISSILKMKPIKQNRFADFKGEIKSLGAWGGDFVLVTSLDDFTEIKRYFAKHKLEVVFKYEDLVK